MNNKVILGSIAMDLKRVALGYHRNSLTTAERFYTEALKRDKEIDKDKVKPYLKKLLADLNCLAEEKDDQRKAEKALLLSTLFQNAAITQGN